MWKEEIKEIIEFWNEFETFEEAWNACERGDWMLWIVHKLGKISNLDLILTKGLCAEKIKHLMVNISKEAVDFAIAYSTSWKLERGVGSTREKLVGLASMARDVSLQATERAKMGVGPISEANAADAAYLSVKDRNEVPLEDIATTIAGAVFEYQVEKGPIKREDLDRQSYYDSLKQTANICRKCLTKSVMNRVKDLGLFINLKKVTV